MRRALLAVAIALAATLVAVPAAAEQTNFNESGGCDVAGYRTPITGRSGGLPREFLVYGPWADYYGRNYDQVSASMVDWVVPGSGGAVRRVHRRALPAFRQVADNLAAAASAGNQYQVATSWGWSWRSVAGGGGRMSQHAFGTAVDINPPANPFLNYSWAPLITDMPEWYVQAWMDAGFCWGGDWINKKDAMHYSWRGPLATSGYGPAPDPYPPLSQPAPFANATLRTRLGVAPSYEWAFTVADRSRDGASDVYAARWAADGRVRLEILGAVSDFRVVGARLDIAVEGTPDTHDLAWGDFDGDNWVDLWVIDRASGETVVLGDSGGDDPFSLELARLLLPPARLRLFGDYDRDHLPDLYSLGDDGTLTVLRSAGGFADALVQIGIDAPGAVTIGDQDVDGLPDLYVAQSNGHVAVLLGSEAYQSGPPQVTASPLRARHLLAQDYDGDGRSDLYLIRNDLSMQVRLGGAGAGAGYMGWFRHPSAGLWDAGPECVGPSRCDQVGYVSAASEFNLKDDLSSGGSGDEFFFGRPGDVALAGDWDCDGVDSPGMYRPSNGYAYLANTNATVTADSEFYFGTASDVPLAGDWDGDGCDTLGIYRPGEGRVYLSNRLGTRAADLSFVFGLPGDRPFVGDFDGDGIDEVGLYRRATGFVYFRLDHTTGRADFEFFFGDPGDEVVAGDWDGNGTDTVAIFRPAEGRWYLSLANAQRPADHVISFGPEAPVRAVAGVFGE